MSKLMLPVKSNCPTLSGRLKQKHAGNSCFEKRAVGGVSGDGEGEGIVIIKGKKAKGHKVMRLKLPDGYASTLVISRLRWASYRFGDFYTKESVRLATGLG